MTLFSTISLSAALALTLSLHAADPSLTNQKQRASYGLGMNVGKRFKHDMLEIELDAFMRGFKDALSDTKSALTEAELTEAMSQLREEVGKRAAEQAVKNKKEGEDFLAKNKSTKGLQ